jgi:hypothetical protein
MHIICWKRGFFLKQRQHDANNDNLNKYEYRVSEIVREKVVESFIRLKDKSSPSTRKTRIKLLKSTILSFYCFLIVLNSLLQPVNWRSLKKILL